MRIITPEIINAMNHLGAESTEFDLLWDSTIKELDDHHNNLLLDCHPAIKNFLDKVNLFECPVHSRSRNFQTDEYPIIVGVPTEAVYSLHYEILKEPVVLQHRGEGFDPNSSAFWLYDEFHKVDNHYEHHIIFSDGCEIQIPFVFFFCRKQRWFEE